MARKNTAKCNEIKKPPEKVYEVAVPFGEQLLKEHFVADCVYCEGDTLVVLDIDGDDENRLAEFKDWLYYRVISDRGSVE